MMRRMVGEDSETSTTVMRRPKVIEPDPLQTPLPNASSLQIACLYGVGNPTSRAFSVAKYATLQVGLVFSGRNAGPAAAVLVGSSCCSHAWVDEPSWSCDMISTCGKVAVVSHGLTVQAQS